MSKYTISDVREADRLWDEYPKRIVSKKTGIPEGTLDYWSQKGLISTDTDHRGPKHTYDQETIEKVDGLWEFMPLTEISTLLEIPRSTLQSWADRGKISTDTEHRGKYQTKDMARKVRRAAHLAYEKDITKREAARRMGVSESTFYRYLRLYREGKYA